MAVTVKWHDKEFERRELDPAIVRWMNRIGARGEALAKHIISGGMGAGLRAVDKGFLMNSLSWVIDGRRQIIRIGTYIARSDGKSLKYAVFVFMGFVHFSGKIMKARPVLRTMLAMLRRELR